MHQPILFNAMIMGSKMYCCTFLCCCIFNVIAFLEKRISEISFYSISVKHFISRWCKNSRAKVDLMLLWNAIYQTPLKQFCCSTFLCIIYASDTFGYLSHHMFLNTYNMNSPFPCLEWELYRLNIFAISSIYK